MDDMLSRVINEHAQEYPKRPEYKLESLSRLSKTYRLYVYLNDPEDIYVKRAQFLKAITESWEKAKQEAQAG